MTRKKTKVSKDWPHDLIKPFHPTKKKNKSRDLREGLLERRLHKKSERELMKNIKNALILGLGIMFMQNSHAQYSMDKILNLRNDKEVVITSIKKNERLRISEKFKNQEFNTQTTKTFYTTIQSFLNQDDKQCELRLIDLIKKDFERGKIDSSEEGLQDIFKMLRITNAIDDIFYDILTSLNKDFTNLGGVKLDRSRLRISFNHKKLIKNNDVKELFSGFTEWPDESSRCVYKEYVFIKGHIRNQDDKLSLKKSYLKTLSERALKENVIDLATFNKLEYLRTKSTVNKRNYWLADYFKIIFNAKNKMRPIKASYVVKNIEDESDYSTERIKRFSKITRRKLLYKKYDETQIILLSQVLQKASRRMGVDPDTHSSAPVISQEFQILNELGTRDTYVERIELDPQSQYNLARRLLRKDMTELQMMDIFIGLKITHEDVVMAALETGYISLEDIEYVVKYDDLWNPHKSDFEKIVGFVGTVAGVSTIFLPPPWNITASIAVGIIEGLVLSKNKNGARNDNPSTFIE